MAPLSPWKFAFARSSKVDGGFWRWSGTSRSASGQRRSCGASEERFRTLVQFSFDVYWETDTEHRFTRQVFAEGLADAPAPGTEVGKTRWEVPYLEPDEEAWRKHRKTLDAHLPFRDFELARPTPDGGKRYVSVSGLPMFDESGRFIGYRGVGRHITERKKAEEALRRSEAYLAEAQRLSNAGAFAFNEKGSLYWSEGTFRLWGFDPLKGIPSPRSNWGNGFIPTIATGRSGNSRRHCARNLTIRSNIESFCPTVLSSIFGQSVIPRRGRMVNRKSSARRSTSLNADVRKKNGSGCGSWKRISRI